MEFRSRIAGKEVVIEVSVDEFGATLHLDGQSWSIRSDQLSQPTHSNVAALRLHVEYLVRKISSCTLAPFKVGASLKR